MIFLLDSAFKVALLLTTAFCVTTALRRGSAALRHMIWAAATASAILIPIGNLLMPAWQPNVPASATSILAAASEPAPAPEVPVIAGAISAQAGASSGAWTTAEILFSIWIAGFVVFLAAFVAGAARLAWLGRQAAPFFHSRWRKLADELSRVLGIREQVRFLQHSGASMLVTWGSLQPQVLLPAGAENWTDDRIRAVLGHELAHIRRRDWTIQVLAEVVRAVYWFNPLVWIGSSRLRRESEHACDDAVLNLGFNPAEYAEHLLDLARTLKDSKMRWSPGLAMARPTNLERRFLAMLNPSLNRGAVSRKAAILTAALTLCLVLPLAALHGPSPQLTGGLSGGVYDQAGAPVPNATVIVWSEITQSGTMSATNTSGVFNLPALPNGPYVLRVLAYGFIPSVPETITIAGSTLQRTITMIPGRAPASSPVPQRIRIGGAVAKSKLVKQPPPTYPDAARAARIQGVVILEGVIGTDGKISALTVINGHPDLTRAAVEAVSQWQYEPTRLNDKLVEVVTTISVTFSLDQ